MKNSDGRFRRNDGFTLVEVMVALAIIALALTSISITMSGMLGNATAMRDRTYASWIAQNKIVEMRAAGTNPEVGETSGEVLYAGAEWAWRAVVAETGVENLWRLDVTVGLPGSDENIRSVTGFVGEPIAPGQANGVWIGGIRRGSQDGEDGEVER